MKVSAYKGRCLFHFHIIIYHLSYATWRRQKRSEFHTKEGRNYHSRRGANSIKGGAKLLSKGEANLKFPFERSCLGRQRHIKDGEIANLKRRSRPRLEGWRS